MTGGAVSGGAGAAPVPPTDPVAAAAERVRRAQALDLVIARVLSRGTLLAVACLAVGVVLMALTGVSPLAAFPPLDIRAIPSQIKALDPVGFLWLGLIVIILTPTVRVAASLIGFSRVGDRSMVLISLGVLGVIAASVVIAAIVS